MAASKQKIVIGAAVWVVILGICMAVLRGYIFPAQEQAAQEAEIQKKEELLASTSSDSAYKYHISFGIDSFSGYCLFRSGDFNQELRNKEIKVEYIDDGADYVSRLRALKNGDLKMAVFTVDALIKASAELGSLPATIVAIVDETRGADSLKAYKGQYPNVDSLNNPQTKFVLVPDSPSETLVRILMSRFGLNKLGGDSFIEKNSAKEVYDVYRQAKPNDNQVYVTWEPWGTKFDENPNVHTVIDSSRFRGYIVDVIVVSRDFLAKDGQAVQDFIEAYFRTVHKNRSDLYQLVIDDAKSQGQPVTEQQARNLVKGVWWKNTTENYAHMGVRDSGLIQHIEDIIEQCTDVLVQTNAISFDPTSGQPNLLYYNRTLENLNAMNFHPGFAPESVRDESVKLRSLTESEWDELRPIGTLEVPQLHFARGSDILLDRSKIVLDNLKSKLDTFPHYYLRIEGQASRQGSIEVNTQLALRRAQAAEGYLRSLGVNANRIKAVGGEPSGATTVSFVLGEVPY